MRPVNDGSCFGNIQVIAEAALPNYETEVKKLTVGSSVRVEGEVRPSPGKGQATEVLAKEILIYGIADAEAYAFAREADKKTRG